MAAFTEINELPDLITSHISPNWLDDGLAKLISNLFAACREIGNVMRDGDFSHEQAGSINTSGDHQLHIDLETDAAIFRHLKASGCVHVAASEENPSEINCGGIGPGFSVAFDPLDGSSIVDANFAVGTIIGIWPGAGLLNRTGNEQVASLIAVYGPRVTIVLAINGIATISGEKRCIELTMTPRQWIISNHSMRIAPKCKTFAPGNLRASDGNTNYRNLINFWIEQSYTLRYSGGLVPDVYHILVKGQGVFSNASSSAAKAKLRLLFECAPIALIIEAAGGSTCVAACEAMESVLPVSLLDVPVAYLDKRVGCCLGSTEEVERFKHYLWSS